MRRRLTTAAAILLCVPMLSACADPKTFSDEENLTKQYTRNADASVTYNYADGATEPPASYNGFAGSVTDFEMKLWRSLAKTEKESFVFSPLSATLSLSLLANAASPDLRQELLSAVGGDLDLEQTNQCASYLKSRMENVSQTDETVTLNGALLLNDSVDAKSSFLQADKDYYDNGVFRFDYRGEHAEDKIKSTLPSYVSESGVDLKNGSLNYISSLELSDSWLAPYTDEDLSQGAFKGSDGEKNTVFLRSQESKLRSDSAVGVIKYTAKNPLKLVMILPNDANAFDSYAAGFNSEELNNLLGSVDITKKSTAYLPAFAIDGGKTAVPRSDILTADGAYSLFSDKAGFSSLSYTDNAKTGEVYEVTPAFSLSAAGVNAKGGADSSSQTLSPEKDAVVFDRPFLFLLIDNESNIPVYMGMYR